MARRKKRKTPIMVPEANSTLYEIRYEIAKKLGYIDVSVPETEWWDSLTPMQQSEVNGHVTKLLIAKAQYDMVHGKFKL